MLTINASQFNTIYSDDGKENDGGIAQEQVYLKLKRMNLRMEVQFYKNKEKENNDSKTCSHVATITTSPAVPLSDVNLKSNVVSHSRVPCLPQHFT